jgi:PhnB protein
MTQINAYINFPGNTREAMTFYKECLGGELELMTFEGSSMESHVPAEAKQNILHSMLTNGAIRLMASDMVSADSLTSGNNISLMLDCGSEEEIYRFYTALSAGGDADHPVQPAFWGGLFGHLTDKFGIQWLLNCSPQA